MKIAFLCSNLEPGRDGVGDYTRRLAGELIRQGHSSVIIGLNDWHALKALFEQQEIEGTSISVLRLPSTAPWNQRIVEARNWLDAFNPDWISLQFVTFGFHRKGLCLGLGKRLAAINSKASWHIMFHELWLGLGEKSPLKHRVLGALQQTFILDLLSRLRPQIVHTQAEPYRKVLSRKKVAASILPLISNVPYATGDGWVGLLEPLLTESVGEHPDRTKLYLAGIFGAVHPEWNAEQAVNILSPLVQKFQKHLVLVFLGRSGLTPEAFNKFKSALRNRADVVTAGERNGFEISRILKSLDLGLATSPRQIIQKSGSVAAMLEHGLRVLVTRDDWRLRGTDLQLEEASSQLLSPRQFALLKTLPVCDLRPSGENSVKWVANQMLASMDPTLSANGSGL
jgi:hypothetical protein